MYFYYTETTIFRLGNLSSACLLSAGVELFESPYLGWAYMRLIIYFLLPISIACLLRNIIGISKITSLLVSFILSTITLFILSDTNGAPFYMYGLDLTAYGIATITFYLLISIFSKIGDSQKYFFAFSVLLILNMTALETFLIISGIFILIYSTYYYYKIPFIKSALITREIFLNNKIIILLLLYFFCIASVFFSPSLKNKLSNVTRISGSFFDGMLYIALSAEETIYLLYNNWLFIIIIFVLGFFIRLKTNYTNKSKDLVVLIFLFFSPILYLFIIGFLHGITPDIWVMPLRTEDYQFIGKLLSNEPTAHKGAFGIRQNLFLFSTILLIIFLMGFFAPSLKFLSSRLLTNKFKLDNSFIFIIVFLILLFHPDGYGSNRILSALSADDFNLQTYHPQKNESHQQSIIENLFPNSSFLSNLRAFLFERSRQGQHESVLSSIAVSNYLITNGKKNAPLNLLDNIYMGSKIPSIGIWRQYLIESFGALTSKDDFLNISVADTFGLDEFKSILEKNTIQTPTEIFFNYLYGLEIERKTFNCFDLSERKIDGYHNFGFKNLRIPKGFSYFIFEALPSKVDVFVKISNKKTSIILPLLANQIEFFPWEIYSSNSIKPVFRQNEIIAGYHKMKFVIISDSDQEIDIYWQHTLNGSNYFLGNKENISYPCSIYFGLIN